MVGMNWANKLNITVIPLPINGTSLYSVIKERNKKIIIKFLFRICLLLFFCALVLLLFQDTFARAKNWVKELQRQASPNIVIALAGNKADLANKRAVDFQVRLQAADRARHYSSADATCAKMYSAL